MPNYLKNLLFELGAIDLGFAGNKFTWSNKRWGKGSIRERLDRGIASVDWRMNFPRAVIYHLGEINSDHCLLILDSNPVNHFSLCPFRFEAAWVQDPRCTEVVRLSWNRVFIGSHVVKLCHKQKTIANALKKWNKEEFGFYQTRINDLMKLIKEIQSREVSSTNARLEANLQGELNEWLTRNDTLWKQKSREIWLRNGDRNTKFFHLSTIIHRRQHSIDAIIADSRDWIIDKKDIDIRINSYRFSLKKKSLVFLTLGT